MTNLEKIKKLRVRQMANFIKELIECHGCHGCRLKCFPHKKTCEQTLVEWLKSEVEYETLLYSCLSKKN